MSKKINNDKKVKDTVKKEEAPKVTIKEEVKKEEVVIQKKEEAPKVIKKEELAKKEDNNNIEKTKSKESITKIAYV